MVLESGIHVWNLGDAKGQNHIHAQNKRRRQNGTQSKSRASNEIRYVSSSILARSKRRNTTLPVMPTSHIRALPLHTPPATPDITRSKIFTSLDQKAILKTTQKFVQANSKVRHLSLSSILLIANISSNRHINSSVQSLCSLH
jgi:hypothetical protein